MAHCVTRASAVRKTMNRNLRNNGENSALLLAFLLALAAELLEFGKDGAHVELARFFLGLGCGRNFSLLARGGLGSRQQGRAGIDRGRLFLVGALHFEIEIDLR